MTGRTAGEALDAVSAALTAGEKSAIIRRWRRARPDSGCATAEDVIVRCHGDYLWMDQQVQPFLEANPDLLHGSWAATFAAIAAALLGWPVTRDTVTRLMHRAGLLRALGRDDIKGLAREQRERAEATTGLSAIAWELGSAALGQALYEVAVEEEKLAARLDALAAAEALHEYPARS